MSAQEPHAPNEEDLTTLYKPHGPVYRHILSIVRDPEAARDLLQTACLKHVRHRGSLRGDVKPSTFLFTIASGVAVDYLRHRARWTAIMQEPPGEDDGHPTPGQDVALAHDVHLGQIEARHDVEALTRDEPDDLKSLVRLRFAEGCTWEEAGQELGLDRKTASRLLKEFTERARARGADPELPEINPTKSCSGGKHP